MMGLTFAIGFLVAGVIRLIAYWADSFDFYNAHQEELKRLKGIRKLQNRHMIGWGFFSPLRKGDSDYALGSYYQGESDEPVDPEDIYRFYHETSPGASDFGLMDYYYPSDAKISILEHQQQDAERIAREAAKETKRNDQKNR